ncbi:uncharacterized protein LOC129245863 [Anastrepha obliqua]|uniref:uncharacterized protein LOC128868260 n=1 Tax=Anastrepha ludens TaxID=28586 RepID=UPI0023AF96D0|nr:uncharacterized protein LOC128868260 [Anastrepha ludens]XP_054740265.1 uncharacterized protein LOC129245863 [Anastrepha obliqua]
MCSKDQYSEMKDKFKSPKLKTPKTTRARCYEQFLWQELYDEYIRYNDRLVNIKPDKANSEYFEEFCKKVPKEDIAKKERLINIYPLYSTSAITLWNNNGDITKDFKKRYTITRPVQEQTEQFG